MPTILNLGAGSVEPLQKSDLANITEFRDWDVVNLDIYNQIVKYSPDRSQIPFPNADIRYSDVERRIAFQDGSVDITLAVSPYGYSDMMACRAKARQAPGEVGGEVCLPYRGLRR